MLRSNTTLRHIDLRWNQLLQIGARGLIDGMEHNLTLQQVGRVDSGCADIMISARHGTFHCWYVLLYTMC